MGTLPGGAASPGAALPGGAAIVGARPPRRRGQPRGGAPRQHGQPRGELRCAISAPYEREEEDEGKHVIFHSFSLPELAEIIF